LPLKPIELEIKEPIRHILENIPRMGKVAPDKKRATYDHGAPLPFRFSRSE
jgi:hypothetical protein